MVPYEDNDMEFKRSQKTRKKEEDKGNEKRGWSGHSLITRNQER